MVEQMNALIFLKELKVALNYNPKISITKLCKEHKISTNVAQVLLESKLITNDKGSKTWNTIEPNIAMASELVVRTTIYSRKYYKSKPTKKDISTGKQFFENSDKVMTIHKPKKKIDIFWGLIKIEY